MDRTNWKFGDVNIIVLVLGIAYDHMSFLILFRLLQKRAYSNFKERINIMERFIRLFGRDSIKCLVVDREFVGNEWFKWLNDSTRFERTIPPYRQMHQVMRTTMQEHRQRSIPTSYITNIVAKDITIMGSTLLRLWSWFVIG